MSQEIGSASSISSLLTPEEFTTIFESLFQEVFLKERLDETPKILCHQRVGEERF